MIKVETALQMSTMTAKTYIWVPGMSWQIPEAEDTTVLKVEVFGEELQMSQLAEMPDSELIRTDKGVIVERVWYGFNARQVSRKMRELYP